MGENMNVQKLLRNRGRYYRKISISIFCALFSIILVFCIALFAFAARDTRRRNMDEDAAILEQAQASLNYISTSARSACRRISDSIDIVSLLSKEAPKNENELYEAIVLMDKTKQSIIDIHDFITSLAVYSQKADRIYSSANGLNYQDPVLLEMLEQQNYPRRYPTYRIMEHKHRMVEVLTFALVEEDSNGALESAVFINVNKAWLENDLLQAMSASNLNDGALFVINDRGEVVIAKGQVANIEPQELTGQECLYKGIRLNGKHYHLSAVRNSATGMQILWLRSSASAHGNLWTYLALILAVLLAAFGVSFGLASIITRIIYKPIGILTQKIGGTGQDEIHTLNTAYASLGDTRMALLEAQKTEKLHQLLRADPENLPSVDISNLVLDPHRPMTLLLFRLDMNNEQEPRGALEQLVDQLVEQLKDSCVVESVQMDFLTVACIVQTINLSDRNELIAALEEQCSLQSGITYAVGVSGRIPDISSLPGAYKEALNAVGKRFFYGDRAVLPVEQMQEEQRNVWQDHAEVFRAEEQMLSDIKNGRMKELERHLDEYLNLYNGYAPTELVFFQSHLICSMNSLINQINQLRMRPILLNVSQMNEDQTSCATIRQLRAVLLHYMKQLCCQMQTTTEDKHAAVVEMVKNIIREEYADPGLCLASISTRVNLSPNYVGRIFKYATNLSVAAYINDVRLQHAVDWIEHSNIKVNLILEKVGFTNQSSFYKSFKQKYGIAPKEYALKARKENESSQESD